MRQPSVNGKMIMIGACLGWMAAAGAEAHADDIVLRSSVRLSPEAHVVRLQDIASLQGPAAQAYADTVIIDAAGRTDAFEIDVHAVRSALNEVGVHWGQVNLTGVRTVVRPAPGTGVPTPKAMKPLTLVEKPPPAATPPQPELPQLEADAWVYQPTLRGELARLTVRELKRAPQNVRIRFQDHQREILDRSTRDFAFEIRPTGSLHSERVVFEVRAWQNERVADQWLIPAELLIYTDVPTLTRAVTGADRLEPGDFVAQQQWLPPNQAELLAPFQSIAGHTVGRRMRAGDRVRATDLARPVVIERGDSVAVRCLVGGHVITIRAVARSEGAVGDAIEVRKVGERDTLTATVAGPGEALIEFRGG